MRAGETLTRILRAAQDEESQLEDLARIFSENQAYVHFLKKFDLFSKRVGQWEAEDPQLQASDLIMVERLFRLVGREAARGLTASIALNRVSEMGLPRLKSKANDSKQKLKLNPREQLKYAHQIADFFTEHKMPGADAAFRAAMHYDFLNALLNKHAAAREVLKYVEEAFKEGLTTARVTFRLATRLKRAQLGDGVFAAALLMPLGKIAMMALFPPVLKDGAWLSVKTGFGDFELYEFFAYRELEAKKFGVSYLDLSAQLAGFAGFSPELAPVLRHVRTPYALEKEKGSPELAILLSVAEILTAHVQGVGVAFSAIFLPWQKKWLQGYKLDLDQLKAVAEELKKAK